MAQDISQLIKIEEEYSKHPEHFEWIADLQTAWEVALNDLGPEEIRWNTDLLHPEDLRSGFYYAGIRPSAEFPEISNRVFCVGPDGKALSSHLGAPILMSYNEQKLDRLSNYKIRKVQGEETKEPFDVSKLFDILKIPGNTPVYETAFFLPVPLEDAGYETHFFPMLTSSGGAANYMIVEDNLIPVGQISDRGHGRKLMSIDKDNKQHYIKAKYTPDAIRDGKIVLPQYEGRIIIISMPVVVENKAFELYRNSDFRNFQETERQPRMSIYATRSFKADVNTVSLETGMESNHRSTEVEAKKDVMRPPVIYDIRCLGVRRTNANQYTPEALKGLFSLAYSNIR